MGADVFSSPLQEALPLADKPHLLQPNARREELFGIPRTHTHNTSEFYEQVCLVIFMLLFFNIVTLHYLYFI